MLIINVISIFKTIFTSFGGLIIEPTAWCLRCFRHGLQHCQATVGRWDSPVGGHFKHPARWHTGVIHRVHPVSSNHGLILNSNILNHLQCGHADKSLDICIHRTLPMSSYSYKRTGKWSQFIRRAYRQRGSIWISFLDVQASVEQLNFQLKFN